MTTQALKARKELLASKVSSLVSDTNENLLRVNLTKFFTDLEAEIQKALLEYYNDTFMLQGQINLILAPIHEKHQEYYELIMRHKLQEFKRAKQSANRIVKREQKRVAMKSAKPVKFTANRNNLFGTLKYSEDRLANNTFTATENTLNRVDSNINQILTDGYRSGAGINEVGRQITERFDQLRTWEANRIARTEIHTAQNMGIMSSYESLGVEYTQWIAANDARTRDSHIEVDGEIIAFGEQYSNGLSYPGDTSGPIEEWINCRCSNAPFVMPAGMMAPSFSPFKESDLVPIEVETPTVTEPKPKEQPTITLKEHLQNELPSDFTEQSIDYLVDKVKRRANAKREYGQIFDYKTGKNTSPEFNGGKSSVNIKEKDWIKPLKEFTKEEMIDALSNRSKYEKSFVDGSNSLASIHNHPSDGSRAFSGADIFLTATNKWEDYGIAISDKEIWISQYKGKMSEIEAKDIEKKVDRLFKKSRKQAQKQVMEEYDDLPYKEKREIESELLKDIFGDNLLNFFNKKNKEWGIKLRRVRYAE